MRPRSFLIALPGLLISLSCGSEPGTGPDPDTIVLSQSQATQVVNSFEAAASSHPDIASLADTMDVVVKAGAEVRRISVATNTGTENYYAIGLHRAVNSSGNDHSTFHVIGFDDVFTPTKFLVLGGFRQTTGAPPTSVTGSFAAPGNDLSVTGHLFTLSGFSLSVWHAIQGTSTLTVAPASGACVGFQAMPNVTCSRSTMTATFDITSTTTSAGSTTRTASASSQSVPAITLTWTNP
jgi:hypothetical protein